MIDAGADVNLRKYGITALMVANLNGQDKCVNLLKQAGDDGGNPAIFEFLNVGCQMETFFYENNQTW